MMLLHNELTKKKNTSSSLNAEVEAFLKKGGSVRVLSHLEGASKLCPRPGKFYNSQYNIVVREFCHNAQQLQWLSDKTLYAKSLLVKYIMGEIELSSSIYNSDFLYIIENLKGNPRCSSSN